MKAEVETYSVWFDRDLQTVFMEWNGYATSEQFREGTELMLNTLIQNRCTRVVAKLNTLALIAQEDQKWLECNFIPRAVSFGFRSIAIVKPVSYFSKVAVETVSGKVDRKTLTISFFETMDEAIASLTISN